MTIINPSNNCNFSLKAATIKSLVRVAPETKVVDAIEQIRRETNSCHLALTNKEEPAFPSETKCIIVIENERLVGVFTRRDIVRLIAMGIDLKRILIGEVMTKNWLTIPESDYLDIFSVVNLFRQTSARHIVIINYQNQVVGLITPESTRKALGSLPHLKLQSVVRVMNPAPIAIASDTSIEDTFAVAIEQQTDCIVVVELNEAENFWQPIGLITEQDLVQLQGLELDLQSLTVAAVMSECQATLKQQDSLWKAEQEMERSETNWLVVTGKRGGLLGTISRTSILLATDSLEIHQKVRSLETKIAQLEKEKELLKQKINHF